MKGKATMRAAHWIGIGAALSVGAIFSVETRMPTTPEEKQAFREKCRDGSDLAGGAEQAQKDYQACVSHIPYDGDLLRPPLRPGTTKT